MDLQELRNEINDIDNQLQELFNKRMQISFKVAEYKIANNMPVFQSKRENEILDHVTESSPKGLESASRVFFQNIMDISKCRQYQEFFADSDKIEYKKLDLTGHKKVAVPGTTGSYSHIACKQIFSDFEPMFFEDFEDVFSSVENGSADFGILPIANSTAGSVGQTYELMKKHDFKICAATKVKISHCLAVKKGTRFENIKIVYSHEQALSQCSEFLSQNGLKSHKYANTALAACYIKKSNEPYAAICSEACAQQNDLEILRHNIANAAENYTKFILISKETLCSENADIVAVSLALPHTSSALYRLLTKFSVAGLNLSMIESRPIANTDFDVVFYLDFEGAITSPDVAKLMSELNSELSYFKFLGNYEEI